MKLIRNDSYYGDKPAWREVELRVVPNDSALTRPETASGVPSGTPMEWPAVTQNVQGAWDRISGAGVLVGVIDTGVDGSHPEFSSPIAFYEIPTSIQGRLKFSW